MAEYEVDGLSPFMRQVLNTVQDPTQQNLQSLSQTVSEHTASLASFATNQGDLTSLKNSDKSSLVNALNQSVINQFKLNQFLNKVLFDKINSVTKSQANYADQNISVFTENWSNLSNWVQTTTGATQVSANKLYGTATGGGYAGLTHSYQLNSSDNMRAVFLVTIVAGSTSDGIIIGASNATAGSAPAVGGGDSFGIYFSNAQPNIQQMNQGVNSDTVEKVPLKAGSYMVVVTVDQTYISVSAVNLDGSTDASCRILRSSFNVNNLYVFNSDRRGLTGSYVGLMSAHKGLTLISPKTFSEGSAYNFQWTGDGTQSFRVYLPHFYDSRIPSPLAICFHGYGSNETTWTTNANYSAMRKALLSAGYIVLSCCVDGNTGTWGNSATTTAYYNAYKYVRDNYAIGNVVIFANSMGGIESLNAISLNQIPCIAWAATSTTFNLKNNYDNPSFTASIKSAYGISSDGTDYATKTQGSDPALMSAYAFRGLPMWVASAVDDTTVSKVDNKDKLVSLVTGVAKEVYDIDVPSGGHSFDITPYTTDIIGFFNKYVYS